MCETLEKNVREVTIYKILVCACKSQDFAQSKNFFDRLETLSGILAESGIHYNLKVYLWWCEGLKE